MKALSAMNFPLSTPFILSHKFWYVVDSCSLTSKKSLTISSYTVVIQQRAIHEFVGFLLFLLLLYSTFIQGDLIGCGLFQYSCICSDFLCDFICVSFRRMFHEVLRIKYIFLCLVKCSVAICQIHLVHNVCQLQNFPVQFLCGCSVHW